MARMLIGNVAPETSDDEVKALLTKYGFPDCDSMQRVAGTGSRPAVMVVFEGCDAAALEALQARVQNLYWKDRRLTVSLMSETRWS